MALRDRQMLMHLEQLPSEITLELDAKGKSVLAAQDPNPTTPSRHKISLEI